ncbi:MAG: zinc-ribbon domain-containing protein [Candidatus Kariarchaeaceae archaeon]|jgi:hypothetical protein
MSTKFCTQCGANNDADAVFCSACGNNFGASPAQKQQQPVGNMQPPRYTDPGYRPIPQQQDYQRAEYIRPPDYVFTKSITERIMGTIKRDVDVVEEIEERTDLQDEAFKLLIFCFGFISLFTILTIFASSLYDVHSEGGTIIEIIVVTFGGGFTFIYATASIGKSIGGHRTDTSRDEIIRVTSYAYVLKVIERAVALLTETSDNILIDLILLVVWVYFIMVMMFVIKRSLDSGYGTAIITAIIAVIISIIVEVVLSILVELIIGDTYGLA